MIKIVGTGVTRHVILTQKYAIKIPRFNYGWKNFLQGMLCNMQEVDFSTMKDDRLCPILFHFPLGLLLIMPKCLPLSYNEFKKMDIERFWGKKEKLTNGYYGDCCIPVEHKIDSFGWYKNNGINDVIVAIDYGD